MKNYKAYCTDLDGTLFDNEGKLSQENETAIKELVERGILFVPTTGRTICELPPCIKNNDLMRYIIYSNGAGVIDRATGWKSEELIDAQTVKAVMDILADYDAIRTVHKDGDCFVNGDALGAPEKYHITEAYIRAFKDLVSVEDDFISFARDLGNVEMICVFFAKNANKDECVARLKEIRGIEMTSSVSGNVEIISEKANKGSGVRRFREYVGISRDDIIGVGDQKNDIELLKASGLALAVANASPELKAFAKETICKNTEHTVKYVLDKFFA